MDKKFFVPYKTAKILKEKGYSGVCDYFYAKDKQLYFGVTRVSNSENDGTIAAPTYHEVVDWLAGKGIRIEVRMAYRFREKQWSWCGYVYVVEDEDYETSQLADWCSTREEALNEGILKALEML